MPKQGEGSNRDAKGPKYLTIRHLGSHVFKIVIMVLGSYLIVGHLDP